MRVIIGILVRLVVLVSFLIFVGWIVGGLYLDRAIKNGVQTVGPKVTGTPVSLDKVNISVATGNGRVKGLVIGNPKGFHTKSAYHVVDSTIKFDPTSALFGKLVIEEIVIDSPEITYEANFSGNNLETITHHVDAFAKKHGLNGSGAPGSRQSSSGAKLIQINHFIVKNPKLHVSHSIFRGRSLTFTLDDIHLRNIGKASGGVTLVNATSQVLSGTAQRVSQTVSRPHTLLGKRLKEVDQAGKRLSRTAEGQASTVLQAVKAFLAKVGDWVESVVDWVRKRLAGSAGDSRKALTSLV